MTYNFTYIFELFCRHLTKLFDSIAKLKFIESDKAGEKMASGMIAKDGELVPFHGQCDCTGAVSILLPKILFNKPKCLYIMF